jgi:magnesium-transporting ATPase (P-type)
MTTEAALPATPTIGGSPATIRSVGRCILLTIVSFGLWSFAWIYHTADEVSPAAGQEASPPLRMIGWLIPIVNIVVLFLSWRDIDNFLKQHGAKDFSVVVFLLLTLFIPFAGIFTYIIVQNRLNDGWAAATGGQATDAPMEPVDWVFVLLGWVVLGLALIFAVL